MVTSLFSIGYLSCAHTNIFTHALTTQCIRFIYKLHLDACLLIDYFHAHALGELICPAYHELCNVNPAPVSGQCPNSCRFNGDCIDGRCQCFLGFEGHDCSQRKWSKLLFRTAIPICFPTHLLVRL